MSRSNLDSTMNAALATQTIALAILCQLTFASGTRYVWSGVGTLVYAGNAYLGVGSLGAIGDVAGGIDVQSQGTSITLSGIDPIYLGESLTDIQVGAPAKILWAAAKPTIAASTNGLMPSTSAQVALLPRSRSIGTYERCLSSRPA